MKNYIYIYIVCFLSSTGFAQLNTSPQIIINEIGLGSGPTDNFLELIILGEKLDLTDWQIDNYQDPNNPDQGYVSFSKDMPQLPLGTVIIIYNDENSISGIDPLYDYKLNQGGQFQIPFSSDLLNKIK